MRRLVLYARGVFVATAPDAHRVIPVALAITTVLVATSAAADPCAGGLAGDMLDALILLLQRIGIPPG